MLVFALVQGRAILEIRAMAFGALMQETTYGGGLEILTSEERN